MKVALAQINPTVGDLEGNVRKIRRFHQNAQDAGADLVVFPELAVCGYPPLDLLERESFVLGCETSLGKLAGMLKGVPAVVGGVLPNPAPSGRRVVNVAVVLAEGRIQSVHAKTRLPTYDVYDEDRYFEPASQRLLAVVQGVRVGISVCEDIWPGPKKDRNRYPVDPLEDLQEKGLQLLINLSASPFNLGKGKQREELLCDLSDRLDCPILMVNLVGGNDSLLFDGQSLAVLPGRRLVARAEAFKEDLVLVDLDQPSGMLRTVACEQEAELIQAISMGLQDYMSKCGFDSLVLGLSGGVDSAVCAVLASQAIGPEGVWALAMPSDYSSEHGCLDAERLASNLGIRFMKLPIQCLLETYKSELAPRLGEITTSLTEENLQARIRATLIMALANHKQLLALATGNKSELAMGYCTLYGDMAGGLAPIGDLYKTQVYQLAHYINRHSQVIPSRIIQRPPSAELRPNQTDQDSLPPYELLDPILDLYIDQGLDSTEIVAKGFSPELVDQVVRRVDSSEFKRRQAALVLRVSQRAFGAGRQMPVARGLGRSRAG